MTVFVVACSADAVGDCSSAGGVWDEDKQVCYCTYEQRGTYKEAPSYEQTAWREWCTGLSDLDSVKNKAAVTPAPKGD